VSSRREDLLLDLARLVAKYGADEVLSLAQAMREPENTSNLAALLEQVVAVLVSQRSAKPVTKRERRKSATRRDQRVGTEEIRGSGKVAHGELEKLTDAIVSKPAKEPR
jgi:hypothetical protein